MSRGAWTLGIIFAVPIVGCGFFGYTAMVSMFDVTQTGVRKFGNDVIQEVMSKPGWDTTALLSHSDAHFRSTYPEADLKAKVIDGAAKNLGTFVNGKSSLKALGTASESNNTTFEYTNDAQFTKGRAKVIMNIKIESSGHYLVESFEISPE